MLKLASWQHGIGINLEYFLFSMPKASGYGPEGSGFESLRAYHFLASTKYQFGLRPVTPPKALAQTCSKREKPAQKKITRAFFAHFPSSLK